jgi:exodeoxyribonuclease VII large subunit
MCNVFSRRFPNLEIRLYPVKVQGPGAKEEIAEGVEFFNRCRDWKADVLIVGRGGGSFEDLWAFNEECVVRAVAGSRIPVVSAVGHESDFTLCDYAADMRAGTPSIAAEITVPDKAKLVAKMRDLTTRLKRAPEHAFEIRAQKTDHLASRLVSSLKDALTRVESHITNAAQRLTPCLKEATMRAENRIAFADRRLLPAIDATCAKMSIRLSAASAKLGLLDPGSPLKRGYSLTLNADGRIIRDSAELSPGEVITSRFGKGEVRSRVEP